jgi:hypothetical protein
MQLSSMAGACQPPEQVKMPGGQVKVIRPTFADVRTTAVKQAAEILHRLEVARTEVTEILREIPQIFGYFPCLGFWCIFTT